ncbi:MAG: hypothetical protein QW717_07950 [Candidatus Bathyarchaeia archaeon]
MSEQQVREIVENFIKQKYPSAHHISFTTLEYKARFYEYWVTASFTPCNSENAKQLFFRIDAGSGNLTHKVEEL